MEKINKTLNELIMNFYLNAQDEEDVEKLKFDIVTLITPKLKWKHLYEHVWIGKTPFDYTYTLNLEENGLWKIHRLTYTGTLDQCKKECEKTFMEMYLTTCNEITN